MFVKGGRHLKVDYMQYLQEPDPDREEFAGLFLVAAAWVLLMLSLRSVMEA
jgi:hypothetical protein